jgi:hypothetical protein
MIKKSTFKLLLQRIKSNPLILQMWGAEAYEIEETYT